MRLKSSGEFLQLEAQLTTSITAYKEQPSDTLARKINDYLGQLLHHDDINFSLDKQCDYVIMQKFWRWQARS